MDRPPLPPEREWLTLRAFAAELGVSYKTARVWSAAGRTEAMPRFIKLRNGEIRIRRDWLDDWAERSSR